MLVGEEIWSGAAQRTHASYERVPDLIGDGALRGRSSGKP